MIAEGEFWKTWPKDVWAVYVITHRPSGRCYVGLTSCVRRRWYTHVNALQRRAHHSKEMQKDWNADGPSAFDFEVIEEIPPFSYMRGYLEHWYIYHLHATYNGTKEVTEPADEARWKEACCFLEMVTEWSKKKTA